MKFFQLTIIQTIRLFLIPSALIFGGAILLFSIPSLNPIDEEAELISVKVTVTRFKDVKASQVGTRGTVHSFEYLHLWVKEYNSTFDLGETKKFMNAHEFGKYIRPGQNISIQIPRKQEANLNRKNKIYVYSIKMASGFSIMKASERINEIKKDVSRLPYVSLFLISGGILILVIGFKRMKRQQRQ